MKVVENPFVMIGSLMVHTGVHPHTGQGGKSMARERGLYQRKDSPLPVDRRRSS